MQENDRYHPHHHRQSRMGFRNAGSGGQIVEVEGGHIILSTSMKDRHSKVWTAKGPRDRRIRLSANTAIQFYDVQNRLGYDRPSKAVDWLIKKAKASIDKLAELPATKPTADTTPVVNLEQNSNNVNVNYQILKEVEEHQDDDIVDNQMGSVQYSSFLPASLDSNKSFFPAGGSSTPASINGSLAMPFHHSMSQHPDLNLSVQSSQAPMYGCSGLTENSGFNGSVFTSVTQTTPFLRPLVSKLTNSQLLNYISQRRPLQSSNSPRVRAWVDPLPFSGAGINQDQTLGFKNPSFMPGPNSGMSRFSGFNYPARIQGDEEEHDGISNKSSSTSSYSCH